MRLRYNKEKKWEGISVNSDNFHAGTETKKRLHVPIVDGDAPGFKEVKDTTTQKMVSVKSAEPLPVTSEKQPHNTPGIIILQWLTYAFWGWLIVGLIWLIALVFMNALTDSAEDVLGMLPYAIAGTIVVLPIALTCDLFYRKHEPKKKTGGASVIMIIHAVIFALLGIGALILAVFMLVNMMLTSSRNIDSQLVTVYTAGSAAILYVLAFIRTLQPFKKNLSIAYSSLMAGIAALLLTLALVGPLVSSLSIKQDNLVRSSVSVINSDIQRYISETGDLPKSLGDLSINDDESLALIQEGKITYIAEGKADQKLSYSGKTTPVLRYQLCTSFEHARNSSSALRSSRSAEYQRYPETYSHQAGPICFKLYENLPLADTQDLNATTKESSL